MVIEFQTSTTVMNCWNHSKKHGMNGTPKDQPPNPSQFRLQSYQCILICLGLAPEIIVDSQPSEEGSQEKKEKIRDSSKRSRIWIAFKTVSSNLVVCPPMNESPKNIFTEVHCAQCGRRSVWSRGYRFGEYHKYVEPPQKSVCQCIDFKF